jgi:hypothetical protein
MTLPGKAPAGRRKAILAILLQNFRQSRIEPSVTIDRVALVKQDSPDASFRVVSDVTLGAGT